MAKIRSDFDVTEKAQRPAAMDGRCFYCRQAIGEKHTADCVLVSRMVTVRLTLDYQVPVPADWDAAMVEFHRNEGTWCSDNLVDELVELRTKAEAADRCMCGVARFEMVGDSQAPFLSESSDDKGPEMCP